MIIKIRRFIYIITIMLIVDLEFLSVIFEGIYSNNLSKVNQITFGSEIATCNALPIPTDNEKRYVYTKPFHDKINYKKGVFLTFDDGPSKNTLKILDILNENNIKATFFIVGKAAERYPDIIRKMNESGMCILTHSYTHKYEIYKSLDTYMEDLNNCNEVILNLTNEIPIPFIRFPGGSTNTIWEFDVMRKIKDSLKGKKIRYVDWNVTSEDALESVVAMNIIRNNVIGQCKNKKMVVVLMHDAPTKITTVEALPDIIKFLKESGYVFRTFDDMTEAEEKELVRRKIINK